MLRRIRCSHVTFRRGGRRYHRHVSAMVTQVDPDEPDELAIIEASRTGDAGAFTSLVMRHQGRVRSYVGGYLRDSLMVDDLCQDVFLQAFRDLASYRYDAPFRGWLLAIARHRVLDHLRGELRRQELQGPRGDELQMVLLSWRLAAVEEDATLLPDRDRELAALQRCLKELPGPTARIVSAHYFALLRDRGALRACIEKRMTAEPTVNAT
jgi:RNA polymerase sigma factor (sigma-70 family)